MSECQFERSASASASASNSEQLHSRKVAATEQPVGSARSAGLLQPHTVCRPKQSTQAMFIYHEDQFFQPPTHFHWPLVATWRHTCKHANMQTSQRQPPPPQASPNDRLIIDWCPEPSRSTQSLLRVEEEKLRPSRQTDRGTRRQTHSCGPPKRESSSNESCELINSQCRAALANWRSHTVPIGPRLELSAWIE